MKKIFLILFIAQGIVASAQSKYYVSSSVVGGTGSGNSPANAFNDLADLTATTLQPGDSVFFKCGDVFQGYYGITQSGSTGDPIVFTSYGSGPKPAISGSVALDSWSGTGTEVHSFPIPVLNLVVNNQQEEVAKYPDSGFLYVENGTTNTGFIDTDLAASPDYTGANVCVRTSLWTWESQQVSSHTGTSISFGGFTNQPVGGSDFNNYGYFFFGREDLITMPGEWAFNSGTVYYMPSAGINTSTADIQGTVEYYGFIASGEVHNIVISNIEFRNQYQSGIELADELSSNVRIENCDFKNIVQYGVSVKGTDHIITNCNFNYVDGRSIHGDLCAGLEVSYNTINNNGQFRNYGIADEDNLTGIGISGSDNSFIHHNSVDSVGYCGIRCDGTNSLIERNKISNYMMLLTDGGALKSFGSFSQNIVYRNNLVTYGIFNHDGTPGSNKYIQSASLYFDFDVEYCTFENNVIYDGSSTSIFLNGGSNHNVIRGNIVYGGVYQIIVNDRDLDPAHIYADTIEYNKLFALDDTTVCMRINSQNNYEVGIIDNNWLFNPYSDNNIGRLHGVIGGTPGINYSFTGWQTVLGFDANSKESFVSWTASENYSEIFVNETDSPVTFPLGPNIYLDLDSNVICGEITVDPYYAEILINTGTSCGIGIPENPEMEFGMFPNPANSYLQIISYSDEPITAVEIYSASGALVYSENMLSSNQIILDLSNFESGTYFVKIKSNDSELTQLLVKQ